MAEKKTIGKRAMDYLLITMGTVLYGIGVSLFLDPNNLAPGGVTGIAMILNRLTGLSTGTGILLINIPILAAGLWKFGFRFLISTLYATFFSSVFTNIFARFGALTADPLLASLAGGAVLAAGLALIFRAGATTGGTDIIVKFLRQKYRHLKTGRLFFLLDVLIVTASLLVFDDIDTILYAMLAVVVTSIVFDAVLYGFDEAKLVYIISDHAETIAQRIMDELEAGVTFLRGKGAYSNSPKDVILCVMRNTVAPKAEEIVKQEDPLAFMIISSATEIYGEGYKNIFSEKL
ncbi:MAG TPA: YitT family protein [Candidatus Eisenbergiella intestinipullorum]|nr:YitT family protein [Candidatus Eisenbergiella intestinipullorum]